MGNDDGEMQLAHGAHEDSLAMPLCLDYVATLYNHIWWPIWADNYKSTLNRARALRKQLHAGAGTASPHDKHRTSTNSFPPDTSINDADSAGPYPISTATIATTSIIRWPIFPPLVGGELKFQTGNESKKILQNFILTRKIEYFLALGVNDGAAGHEFMAMNSSPVVQGYHKTSILLSN